METPQSGKKTIERKEGYDPIIKIKERFISYLEKEYHQINARQALQKINAKKCKSVEWFLNHINHI